MLPSALVAGKHRHTPGTAIATHKGFGDKFAMLATQTRMGLMSPESMDGLETLVTNVAIRLNKFTQEVATTCTPCSVPMNRRVRKARGWDGGGQERTPENSWVKDTKLLCNRLVKKQLQGIIPNHTYNKPSTIKTQFSRKQHP